MRLYDTFSSVLLVYILVIFCLFFFFNCFQSFYCEKLLLYLHLHLRKEFYMWWDFCLYSSDLWYSNIGEIGAYPLNY